MLTLYKAFLSHIINNMRILSKQIFFVLVFSLVFYISIFAQDRSEFIVEEEQAGFYANWIIPEGIFFGGEKIPSSYILFTSLSSFPFNNETPFFYKAITTSFEAYKRDNIESFAELEDKEKSFYQNQILPLPPWFIERGFSWDDSYETWKAKLQACSEFLFIEPNEVIIESEYKNGKERILHKADLYVVWKADDRFLISFNFTEFDYVDTFTIIWENKSWKDYKPNKKNTASKNWENLSEREQYICAFASNLAYLNNQDLDSLDPGYFSSARSVLKNSWGITNKQELLEKIEDLESYGHAGAYKAILAIENLHPNLSVIEIAQKECLSPLEIVRLFFVRDMKDKIGEQGLEAWDKGRSLMLFRWALSAGYIDEEEAFEKMEPIVAKLIMNYSSWEDFISHYIAGRAFFGLYDGNSKSLVDKALTAASNVRRFMDVDSLTFQGNNKKKMVLTDAWYEQRKEALDFEDAFAISNTNSSEFDDSDKQKIEGFIKKYPNVPSLYTIAVSIENVIGTNLDRFQLFQEADSVFALSSSKNEHYNSFYLAYAYFLNYYNKPSIALYALDSLSEETQNDSRVFYQRGLAYAKLIGTSYDYEKNEEYGIKAWENFLTAQVLGFELPENLIKWLENISASIPTH